MRLLCPSGTMNIEEGPLGGSGANSVSPNKLDSLLTCRLNLDFRVNHPKLAKLRARILLDRFLRSVWGTADHFQINIDSEITSLSSVGVFLRWESQQYLSIIIKTGILMRSSTQELSSVPSRV